MRANQLEQARVDRRPDRGARAGPCAGGAARDRRLGRAEPRHVLDRHLDPQLRALLLGGVDDGDGPEVAWSPSRRRPNSSWSSASTSSSGARRRPSCARLASRLRRAGACLAPPRKRATSSSGRCVADRPIRCSGRRRVPAQRLEPLERQRQVRAALAGDQRVDLVDDHRVHRRQPLARVRGQQQEQRLGRGDEDVRRLAQEARALAGRRVAGADGDLGRGHRRRRAAARRWRCRPAARAGCARRPPPAPSAARRRARGSAPCVGGGGSNISRLRHQRKAASVLPLPVGARISVDSPRAMAGQPSCCGRVGAGNAPANHSRTAGWKSSRDDATSRSYVNGICQPEAGARRAPGIVHCRRHSIIGSWVMPEKDSSTRNPASPSEWKSANRKSARHARPARGRSRAGAAARIVPAGTHRDAAAARTDDARGTQAAAEAGHRGTRPPDYRIVEAVTPVMHAVLDYHEATKHSFQPVRAVPRLSRLGRRSPIPSGATTARRALHCRATRCGRRALRRALRRRCAARAARLRRRRRVSALFDGSVRLEAAPDESLGAARQSLERQPSPHRVLVVWNWSRVPLRPARARAGDAMPCSSAERATAARADGRHVSGRR